MKSETTQMFYNCVLIDTDNNQILGNGNSVSLAAYARNELTCDFYVMGADSEMESFSKKQLQVIASRHGKEFKARDNKNVLKSMIYSAGIDLPEIEYADPELPSVPSKADVGDTSIHIRKTDIINIPVSVAGDKKTPREGSILGKVFQLLLDRAAPMSELEKLVEDHGWEAWAIKKGMRETFARNYGYGIETADVGGTAYYRVIA